MRRPCPIGGRPNPEGRLFVIVHVRDPEKHYIPGQTRMARHGGLGGPSVRSVHYISESLAPRRTRL